jgi:YqjK-like protein
MQRRALVNPVEMAMTKPFLQARQDLLLTRSAGLRATLGQQLQPLKAPLACVDRGADALRWLQRKPLLAAAIAAAWVALKPGSALTRWGRLWNAWSAARRVLRWAQRG